jgi:uncharacterized protein (DUF4415 family)
MTQGEDSRFTGPCGKEVRTIARCSRPCRLRQREEHLCQRVRYYSQLTNTSISFLYYNTYLQSALRMGRAEEPGQSAKTWRNLIRTGRACVRRRALLGGSGSPGPFRGATLARDRLRLNQTPLRCCWLSTCIERIVMAKKSSASSQPAGLKSMRSEDIRRRKWSDAERQALRNAGTRQRSGDDSEIDFTDIPRLTDEQLASVVRLRDVKRKVAVSVRLDPQVLDWLKSKGEGHLTRINDILANLMEAERRTGR